MFNLVLLLTLPLWWVFLTKKIVCYAIRKKYLAKMMNRELSEVGREKGSSPNC